MRESPELRNSGIGVGFDWSNLRWHIANYTVYGTNVLKMSRYSAYLTIVRPLLEYMLL